MTTIGPDWVPDSDGVPHRNAGRVVLFDPEGRTFLLRGRDGHDADHTWWFTVGGGIEAGEDARDAAVRELREETGIFLSPEDLIGPVLSRSSQFHFTNVTVRQDELFFLAFLSTHHQSISAEGRTQLENEVLFGERWLTQTELEDLAAKDTVYPRALPTLVSQWRDGWDGSCPHLREE